MFPLKNRIVWKDAADHLRRGLGLGVDYVANYVPGFAPFDGKVRTYWGFQGGKWIEFQRNNGEKVRIAHLSQYKIKSGQVVKEGQECFVTGNSGFITSGPHAHIETYDKLGNRTDPEKYDWNTVTYPIVLRVCLLMNYKQQWGSSAFQELQNWFKKSSGGRVEIDIFPAYTAFKEFQYSYEGVSGDLHPVVDRKYMKEYIMPLSFGNPHVTALVIHPDDWKGKPFVGDQPEKGWYYLPTVVPGDTSHLPPKLFVVCKDGEMSQYSYGITAFTEYMRHELSHFLFDKGHPSRFDFTHVNQFVGTMEKMFEQIDYSLLRSNLVE